MPGLPLFSAFSCLELGGAECHNYCGKNTENPVVKLNSHKVKPAREDVFRSLPVPSALRIMILPSVISQLIVLIYNMADTFYVGQTNNPYMVAATSLILPVFNISICIAGLAGVGGG